MKGKNKFSTEEANELRMLIRQRCNADRSQQKSIRAKMRRIGFYGGDDFGITDMTIEKFENLIRTGQIFIANKLDTSKIEREAVFSVSSYINRCPGLVPYINYNDKTPMWDGSIFIYNDDKINNDNFYGIVDVQIKGATNISIDEVGKTSYNLNKSILKAYKKEGGVLFFLVKVDDYDNKVNKIYYKFLNAQTLNKLINTGHANPSFKLDPIQTNEVFTTEIREFYDSPINRLSSSMNIFTKQMIEDPRIIKIDSDYNKVLYTIIDKLKRIPEGKEASEEIKKTQEEIKKSQEENKESQEEVVKKLQEKVVEKLQEALNTFDFLDFKCDYPEYKAIRAKILNDLAGLHMELEQYDQSQKEIEESLKIFQDLAKSDTDTYNENMKKGLSNYAEILEKAGNMEEAKKIEEASNLLKNLMEKNQRHEKDSNDILNRITNVLNTIRH